MFAVVLTALFATAPSIHRNMSCLDERFLDLGAQFASATPSPGAALIPAGATCLDGDIARCTERRPLDPKRQWIAGAREGAWVCVTDGLLYGWIEAERMTFGPLPSPPKGAWTGRWELSYSGGDPSIRIQQRKDGKLHVSGYAEWRAHPDSTPNIGELDFTGLPREIFFDGGDPACLELKWADDEPARCFDCIIRLMLVNDRLIARDNGRCGGMNVSFSTTYRRARPAHR